MVDYGKADKNEAPASALPETMNDYRAQETGGRLDRNCRADRNDERLPGEAIPSG